ncbi:TVP38/TMEM64 family protein [Desulfonatronum lacustre]|uniref:TVP38/TMEM64 family protein n=1 Tax=Desulfonatronum lacustre TaxID=66849 RepID=UPI000688D210|nr:VTT domain-containing protein [Desulfonatronum lacustre]SMP64324.1 Uncharacterized membrane protein YdjX, TVP38/TMEM64 family, SNARE-associated domain [Desulfonatronum zhilinae]
MSRVGGRGLGPSALTIAGWTFAVAILAVMAAFGAAFDWSVVHVEAAQWTHAWWLVPILILAQALPFAFALPGSVMFLVIGLLYDPLPAAAMIAAGGVMGSMAAYYFSGRLAVSWVERVQRQKVYRVLRSNTNFLMLCAMRTLPGFPHSVINYGSGLLRIPLKRFIFSAILGYLVKGMLYASILHNVVDADEAGELFSLEVMWPLLVLAGLFVAGFVLQKAFGGSQSTS